MQRSSLPEIRINSGESISSKGQRFRVGYDAYDYLGIPIPSSSLPSLNLCLFGKES